MNSESSKGSRSAPKRVLVVDDDESLLGFLKEGLELHGYEVSTSRSGSEAIKKIMGGGCDLVISDYLMPGGGGKTLYDLIRSVNPVLAGKMIYITGAPFDRKLIRFLSTTNCTFLTKPLKLEKLIEAMEKVSGNSSGGSQN